ncbi:MAG: hypothetical protein AB7P52_04645 [Alphaproteobacteria bacterium]
MRKMPVVFTLLVAGGAALMAAGPARADISSDIFQVLCMPELDVIEVRELWIQGETAFKAIERPNEQLKEAYGIYAPKWHDTRQLTWDDMRSTDLRTRFECRLSTGLVELTLLPEPLPPHGWGVDASIAVTLTVAGRMIVDDVPFALCENGGPITSLLYNATIDHLVLTGQFGGKRPEPPYAGLAGFTDIKRRFSVEPDGLYAAEERSVGWRVRHGPLQATDIDYIGIDYDRGEGIELQSCRPEFVGPSMPESRKRWFLDSPLQQAPKAGDG